MTLGAWTLPLCAVPVHSQMPELGRASDSTMRQAGSASSFAPAAVAMPGATDGITLQDVIEAAFSMSPQVLLGQRQVDVGLGTLLAARAPFDALLATSLVTERENSFAPTSGNSVASVLTETVTYGVRLPKRLRSGIVITPQIGLTRASVAHVAGTSTSQAAVNLAVLVPLLADRGGAVTAAPERAAQHAYEAAFLDARHATAASVFAAVVAYWDDLAAEQQLDVYRSSEARARQLVEDTRKLVQADERPVADLKQLLANLALKRAMRITGQQKEVEARQQLGLAMGADAASIVSLPRPATEFPAMLPDSMVHDAEPPDSDYGSTVVENLIAAALDRRADLAAELARRSATRVQDLAARDGLRPRLDLTVGLGYAGLVPGGGMDGIFTPLYRNVPSLNASVQLNYELPLANMAARGAALRTASLYDQQRIREADLARRISSGVLVAVQALRHGQLALAASREAVASSREAVENEKRKFQLGMSTLFDVILAEDALTNARLGEIAGQHDYAVAIARLRYETGTLLTMDGTRVSANAQTAMTPP